MGFVREVENFKLIKLQIKPVWWQRAPFPRKIDEKSDRSREQLVPQGKETQGQFSSSQGLFHYTVLKYAKFQSTAAKKKES